MFKGGRAPDNVTGSACDLGIPHTLKFTPKSAMKYSEATSNTAAFGNRTAIIFLPVGISVGTPFP
jgi:hypothetical protein